MLFRCSGAFCSGWPTGVWCMSCTCDTLRWPTSLRCSRRPNATTGARPACAPHSCASVSSNRRGPSHDRRHRLPAPSAARMPCHPATGQPGPWRHSRRACAQRRTIQPAPPGQLRASLTHARPLPVAVQGLNLRMSARCSGLLLCNSIGLAPPAPGACEFVAHAPTKRGGPGGPPGMGHP